MGKLSGSVGNFERKLGSYKDLKAKYTAMDFVDLTD